MRTALIATSLAVVAAAVSGGVATGRGVRDWYPVVAKPGYVPPNAVFPVAWTALYADIAVTSAAALTRFREDGRAGEARGYAVALGANLALNAGWSWIFFGKRRPGAAALAAAALTASSADLALRAGKADPRLGVALAPYPLWCGFATVMTTDIWRLNR